MKVEGRLLIERLMELATERSAIAASELDQLKAHFLAVTSAAAETVGDIDNLSYETITKPSFPGEYSGLTIKSYGGLLSDAIADLFELDLEDSNLTMDRETFRTTLRAAWAIAVSLEWCSLDTPYPNEKAQRLIGALVGSLSSFRETGEP